MKSKLLQFLIPILSITFIIGSCEKDIADDEPTLPPLESLSIDFSDFNNASDTLQSSKKTAVSYSNWGVAFANVAFWNTYTTIKMAVPVIAYTHALQQTPVYIGDKTWEWTYDVNLNSTIYSVSLQTKRISNAEYAAEFYVSGTGLFSFSSFKWFEGVVRYDRTKAVWTVYENPQAPTALLNIEWNYNWETLAGDITYTNIKTADPEKDSYISYAVNPALALDAAFNSSLSNGSAAIEWNRTNLNGRIKSLSWFQNEDWHCWNQFLQNTLCD
jgi:hypothetical protein